MGSDYKGIKSLLADTFNGKYSFLNLAPFARTCYLFTKTCCLLVVD